MGTWRELARNQKAPPKPCLSLFGASLRIEGTGWGSCLPSSSESVCNESHRNSPTCHLLAEGPGFTCAHVRSWDLLQGDG
ncbi:hypothetical protein E2320_001662, partial [Naja naja]